jgi:hypothetical protein
VDVHKRLAISRFYREEFLRHIEQLQAAGILDEDNREVADRACHAFTNRLDQICGVRGFSAVAESLLQSFDALSGLSALDLRQRH